jgi:DnaJ-class molecular chaperone
MDYYKTLGVQRTASESDLKKAYKKLSMQHHPDRGGDAEKFKQVSEAYSTLKDPQKRQQYDTPQQQQQSQGFGPNGFQGMGGFEDLFGQFGFNPNVNRQQNQQQRNPDITIAARITLKKHIAVKM